MRYVTRWSGTPVEISASLIIAGIAFGFITYGGFYGLLPVVARQVDLAVVGCVGVLALTVLHEFGHAWAARSMGLRMERVRLSWTAHVATRGGTMKQRAFVLGAGPAVDAVLASIAWIVAWQFRETALGKPSLVIAAVATAALVVDAFPAYPMDGGAGIQRALQHRGWGSVASVKAVRLVGNVAAMTAAVALVIVTVLNSAHGDEVAGRVVAITGLVAFVYHSGSKRLAKAVAAERRAESKSAQTPV